MSATWPDAALLWPDERRGSSIAFCAPSACASHDVTCPELLPRGPSYFDVLRRETAQCLDEWRARVLFFSCAARGRADGEARQPF